MDNEDTSQRFSPNAIHMLRTSQHMNLQLSAMADQKASILMAASFVIFTIAINQSGGRLPPWPLLVLGAFAFVSCVLTVLAILPVTKLPPGVPVNLLFFGSFSQLEENDYVERVCKTIESDESIFRSMAHDLFQNGRVLRKKKYRLLGIAYRVFLIGLIAALITFVLQYVI